MVVKRFGKHRIVTNLVTYILAQYFNYYKHKNSSKCEKYKKNKTTFEVKNKKSRLEFEYFIQLILKYYLWHP